MTGILRCDICNQPCGVRFHVNGPNAYQGGAWLCGECLVEDVEFEEADQANRNERKE